MLNMSIWVWKLQTDVIPFSVYFCVMFFFFVFPPGLLTLCGVSLYIIYSYEALTETKRLVGPEGLAYVHTSFGWSLGLAWLSFGLELLTGILLLIAAQMSKLQHSSPTMAWHMPPQWLKHTEGQVWTVLKRVQTWEKEQVCCCCVFLPLEQGNKWCQNNFLNSATDWRLKFWWLTVSESFICTVVNMYLELKLTNYALLWWQLKWFLISTVIASDLTECQSVPNYTSSCHVTVMYTFLFSR